MLRFVLSCTLVPLAITSVMSPVSAKSTHSEFIYYPAFDKTGATVEAIRDKGLVQELHVKCRSGVGIITYAKPDNAYCGPDHRCSKSLRGAVNRLCR